jgi:ankyrin repeat protein
MGEDSSPLHAAAAARSAAILRLLLATGAFDNGAVSQADENGWTPLHLAARRGSKECVQLLLQHGADRDAKTTQGLTPLDVARVNKRGAVVALLEQPQPAAVAR